MAHSTETQGPVLFTVGEIGDWDGHEADVVNELNERLEELMIERHGIIHAGGGNWTIVLAGDYPSNREADGKPDWNGDHPLDFDDICNNPEHYLSAELLERIHAAA